VLFEVCRIDWIHLRTGKARSGSEDSKVMSKKLSGVEGRCADGTRLPWESYTRQQETSGAFATGARRHGTVKCKRGVGTLSAGVKCCPYNVRFSKLRLMTDAAALPSSQSREKETVTSSVRVMFVRTAFVCP
jgi:hypothetical protein